ncbi:cell division protein FtsA [Dendrosporobacter sp. 1207_IL3150]|uniref:cell division protein FtsA n=1 Tax=Dendrosporobacter sp. 1207_IL3150 TaxID=3084054 RepID=UPI002FDAF7D8
MGKPGVLAIDIGTSFIKVFSGSSDSSGNVLIYGNGIISTKGFSKGVITNQNEMITSISQAVECAFAADNIVTKQAYIGISGMGVEFHEAIGSIALKIDETISNSDIDKVYRAAVLALIPDELEVLHVLPKTFKVDGIASPSPIGSKGKHLEAEVQIITIPKAILTELVRGVESAGVNVSGVISNTYALGESIGDISPPKPCVVFDIGAGHTDVILANNGQIHAAYSLPLGGDYITWDLMHGLDINNEHAEAIKRYYSKLDKELFGNEVILDCNDFGTTDKNIPYDFLNKIIESRVDEIVNLICEYIKPKITGFDCEEIYITGGCSAMNSFAERLEVNFGIPVKRFVPAGMPQEYSNPVNTACYGITRYAVRNIPVYEDDSNSWSSIIKKVRKFLKN